MTRVPDDLVPLSGVAKRLGVSVRTLVRQSERGEFPACYSITARSWRVSAATVDQWFDARHAAAVAARRDAAAARVRSTVETYRP